MQWPVRSSQAIRNELILVFTGCNHDLNTFTIPKLQPSHCSPPHCFLKTLTVLDCPCYLRRICLCIFTCVEHAASWLFLFLLIEVMALNDLSKWQSSAGSINYIFIAGPLLLRPSALQQRFWLARREPSPLTIPLTPVCSWSWSRHGISSTRLFNRGRDSLGEKAAFYIFLCCTHILWLISYPCTYATLCEFCLQRGWLRTDPTYYCACGCPGQASRQSQRFESCCSNEAW